VTKPCAEEAPRIALYAFTPWPICVLDVGHEGDHRSESGVPGLEPPFIWANRIPEAG
jgi:hypothetical protein